MNWLSWGRVSTVAAGLARLEGPREAAFIRNPWMALRLIQCPGCRQTVLGAGPGRGWGALDLWSLTAPHALGHLDFLQRAPGLGGWQRGGVQGDMQAPWGTADPQGNEAVYTGARGTVFTAAELSFPSSALRELGAQALLVPQLPRGHQGPGASAPE